MTTEAFTIIVLLIVTLTQVPAQLNIGAIHENPEFALQLSVAVAVALSEEDIQDKNVSFESGEPDEPLSVLRALCTLADKGVAGVVVGGGGERVAAAAARAGVPIIEVQQGTGGDISLQPHEENIARAAQALMHHKEWLKGVLLHEGPLTAASNILLPPTGPIPIAARRLPPGKDEPLLRDLLLLLKKGGSRNFVVWCEAECIITVLRTARRVGLLDERHSYILLALDPHQIPLAEFSYGGANITALRLFDPKSERALAFGEAWAKEYFSKLPVKDEYETTRETITSIALAPPAYLLLAYDGTKLLAQAWKELNLPSTAAGSCSGRPFMHVESLVNHIRTMNLPTAAGGPLSFDADGGRRIARLEVVELNRGGNLEPVARWQHGRLEWRRPPGKPVQVSGDSMTNKTFNVLIAMNEPYVMLRQSKERLSGNDRYEGFCIELIDCLAQLLQFNYTFIEQKDREYGKLVDNNTNKWNGMLGRLMDPDDNMDFAITDLTITAQREKVVDFTTPFMNLGISILFKRPKQPEPQTFAFLHPFSSGVWLCLALSYFGTSLVLLLVGRLCPEEWQNPHPCVDEPEALENQFTFVNALWFNLGAVMLQGSEIAPIAYGTRAVASVWWLFALVITSSYTANLATLLAKKSTNELIHNVQELATNKFGITYGAKEGGSTYTFFEQSQNALYKQMYQNMKDIEMPKNNTAGIEKVENENFAFLMESTTIEHLTQRNCLVQQVGGLLDNKGYGIAMKKNSTYRQSLNLALLNLQERGVLREMKHQWWNEKNGGGTCNANDDEVESEELSMKNFYGLFLLLTFGCIFGVVYSFLDLVLHAVRRARSTNVSFLKQLRAELRFICQFSRSVKPLVLPIEDTPESTPSPETDVQIESPEPPGSLSPRRDSQRSRRSRRRSTQHTIHNASVKLARHGRSS